MWISSFCFTEECDPKQQLTIGQDFIPPMGTAEEDHLGAGTTSVLKPLTGPIAVPSLKCIHLNSHSYSSSARN